jgi:hypothetical protein
MEHREYMWGITLLVIMWVAILLVASCGEPDIGFFCKGSADQQIQPNVQKIVGGEPATDRYATVKLYGCTGVAIDSRTVLTAAHCAREENYITIEGWGSTRVIDQYVYPTYAGNAPHGDLAVLRSELDMPGPFPVGVYDPAEGGFDPDLRYYCEFLLGQGYGRGSDGALHELELVVTGVGSGGWLITEAAGDPDTQALCAGDSGGPLYAITADRYTGNRLFWVAGVTSTGRTGPNNSCAGWTTHSYLETYSAWLREARRCLDGGEDQPWDFFIAIGSGFFSGTTCEEARL